MSISRPAHGALDYLFGILLAASPWLFGFTQQHIAPQFAVVCGSATVLYSLLTNYELGLIRLIPFPAHRLLDLIVGFILLTNWFHFAFGGRAGVVFTVFGIIELGTVLMTRRGGPMHTPSMT